MNTDNLFYFVAYMKGKTKITVIDLSYVVSWERKDWAVVNEKTFTEAEDAIE